MGTRRVRSAVQASFNVAQGSVREPHRECAEEEDTPPSSSLLSSWPALGEERGQLTASSPFPLPSRPFVVRPERSCGRSKAAVPTFLFCCTRLMDCCEVLLSAANCCCSLTLSCKYFPSPIILSSYHSPLCSMVENYLKNYLKKASAGLLSKQYLSRRRSSGAAWAIR